MALIREFLAEIDAQWKPVGGEPITLQVIGSAALMLRCDYERGTKDGDILESKELPPVVKAQLMALADKGTAIHAQFRLYIDIVRSAILFVPQRLIFHPVPDMRLKNFSIEALDAVDVVVSKLKRFNANDMGDIRAMADRRLLDHKKLVARFEAAIDMFSTDARSEEFPRYINNLRIVERDSLIGARERHRAVPGRGPARTRRG
ncbi:MAG: hypothetical protein HZB91_01500 [Elusimicrobia bacterium]|nr:hypothetical protein [Elusimicrobiota bacterium]